MSTPAAASVRSVVGRRGSLLLVEDDSELAELLCGAFNETACEVAHASTARLARQQLDRRQWDLVVLDANLPDGDGFELCRELRRTRSATAVLMLTARASEADRVAGLELGADDYLTKPFSLRELLLRAGNLLRRGQGGQPFPLADRVACGEVVIVSAARRAYCRGQELSLTPREFDLLAHLVRNADRVFTRSQLLDAVWGARFEGFEHTVNSHINRLRAKIELDPKRPQLLVTVWGSGYRFVAASGSPASAP
jgi:two-component system OmpR family response regulator